MLWLNLLLRSADSYQAAFGACKAHCSHCNSTVIFLKRINTSFQHEDVIPKGLCWQGVTLISLHKGMNLPAERTEGSYGHCLQCWGALPAGRKHGALCGTAGTEDSALNIHRLLVCNEGELGRLRPCDRWVCAATSDGKRSVKQDFTLANV